MQSAPRTALLVASSGGHLKELHVLRDRLGLGRVTWATFDDAHSRSLLAGEAVHHLRFTGQRDYRNVLRNLGPGIRLLRSTRPDLVVTTGAAVALSVLPAARALGVPCHYIESATRLEGPSLTGRLLERVPGIGLHTQAPAWASGRWSYAGSVLDGFAPALPRDPVLRKIVVTLGTSRQWGFRRAVERLREVLPPEAEVIWQVGRTDVAGLDIDAVPMMGTHQLDAHMRDADVVIAHAGVGSALAALEAGHRPLLLPRRAALQENVDDHQEHVAEELVRRGLAVTADASQLTADHVLDAAARGVQAVPAPPLVLG